VGVQWHPEELPEEFGLFRGFIEAARGKVLSRLVPAAPSSMAAELSGALDGLPSLTSDDLPSL
jgi:putative glutamine amidotransferase